jgi:hypothetical protein
MRTTLAIDFDGVIHSYHLGWHDGSIYGSEIEGAFDSLRLLMKDHNVFIFSSRKSRQILDWISEQMPDVPFEIVDKDALFWNKKGVIGITNRKLAACVYVDDRAVRFDNWKRAMALVSLHKKVKE